MRNYLSKVTPKSAKGAREIGVEEAVREREEESAQKERKVCAAKGVKLCKIAAKEWKEVMGSRLAGTRPTIAEDRNKLKQKVL